MWLTDRPMVEASAAGVEIGAREIYVAVAPDRESESGAGIRNGLWCKVGKLAAGLQ
jgi:hypothetical protein